ncbi:MAG: hypothetical protein QM692_23080, partial [Thermomicrobiales bacterium]
PLGLGLLMIASGSSGGAPSASDWGSFLASSGLIISLVAVAAAGLGVGIGRALRAGLRRLRPPGQP